MHRYEALRRCIELPDAINGLGFQPIDAPLFSHIVEVVVDTIPYFNLLVFGKIESICDRCSRRAYMAIGETGRLEAKPIGANIGDAIPVKPVYKQRKSLGTLFLNVDL